MWELPFASDSWSACSKTAQQEPAARCYEDATFPGTNSVVIASKAVLTEVRYCIVESTVARGRGVTRTGRVGHRHMTKQSPALCASPFACSATLHSE